MGPCQRRRSALSRFGFRVNVNQGRHGISSKPWGVQRASECKLLCDESSALNQYSGCRILVQRSGSFHGCPAGQMIGFTYSWVPLPWCLRLACTVCSLDDVSMSPCQTYLTYLKAVEVSPPWWRIQDLHALPPRLTVCMLAGASKMRPSLLQATFMQGHEHGYSDH